MTYLVKLDNEVLITLNDVRDQFSDKNSVLKLRIYYCNYIIYIINLVHIMTDVCIIADEFDAESFYLMKTIMYVT